MLVMGSPQFQAQECLDLAEEVDPMSQWGLNPLYANQESTFCQLSLDGLEVDPTVRSILDRLRAIFTQSGPENLQHTAPLSIPDRQDLASFVIHKLLLMQPVLTSQKTSVSESIRYATCIYMFLLHGPTYYSHMAILKSLVLQLELHLTSMMSSQGFHDPLSVWLLSIGMVASIGTEENHWFVTQATRISEILGLQSWEAVEGRLKTILWLDDKCGVMFRQSWEQIVNSQKSSGQSTT